MSGRGESRGGRSVSMAGRGGSRSGQGGFIAKALFVCAAAVILLAGISQIRDVVSIVLLAVLISVAALPLLNFLKQRNWPIALILLTIFAAMLVLVFGASMFIPSALKAVGSSVHLVSQLADGWVQTAEQKLTNWGLFEEGFSLRTLIDFERILGLSGTVLNAGVGILSDFFLVITLVMFMLYEAHSTPIRADGLLRKHPALQPAAASFLLQLRHYLLIKLATSTLTAVLLLPVLWIFLPSSPWPWVFLALVMNFVPIFGSVLAAVPPVLLVLVTGDLVGTSCVLAGYLGVNIVVGNILEPKVMGKGLGLSALVVLISLSFWGWILGLVGLFMAVPLTLSIKLLLETDNDLRWLAALLGETKENTKG
ncbi:MAG: AI-2E family transporter [Proteobacteria bacterium]|nr:AI-2E family transporter [Pseudomonadota bacterium]